MECHKTEVLSFYEKDLKAYKKLQEFYKLYEEFVDKNSLKESWWMLIVRTLSHSWVFPFLYFIGGLILLGISSATNNMSMLPKNDEFSVFSIVFAFVLGLLQFKILNRGAKYIKHYKEVRNNHY